MQLIYAPEGGERREFKFRPYELMSYEAELLESVGGDAWDSFGEWANLFDRGSIRARRAALWLMLRREQPELEFSSLVIRVDEVWPEREPDTPEESASTDAVGKDESSDSDTAS